jgi:hypothetical protein
MRADQRERNTNFAHMKNHLHECMYYILRRDMPEAEKFPGLRRYKANLVQLHATRREKTILDTSEHDRMDEEEPPLFHLLKTQRRRNMRAIQRIQNSKGNIVTEQHE